MDFIYRLLGFNSLILQHIDYSYLLTCKIINCFIMFLIKFQFKKKYNEMKIMCFSFSFFFFFLPLLIAIVYFSSSSAFSYCFRPRLIGVGRTNWLPPSSCSVGSGKDDKYSDTRLNWSSYSPNDGFIYLLIIFRMCTRSFVRASVRLWSQRGRDLRVFEPWVSAGV